MKRPRIVPLWLVVVLFVVVPLLEIYVLVQVGQVIGAWWTILLLLAASVVGGWLIRREGSRAWRAFRDALSGGRMPAREIADGILILVGGVLMIAPGFVSDLGGILLLLPITRPVARRLLTGAVAARLGTSFGPTVRESTPGGGPGRPDARHPGDSPQGPVVRGEVVD